MPGDQVLFSLVFGTPAKGHHASLVVTMVLIPLAVERIHKIKRSGSHFEYPADFDPEQRCGSIFDIIAGEPFQVKIWFSADQARYIKERQWTRTQTIEDQADGSIILSMTVSSKYTLKRWLLSQGAEAEVLEPEEFRVKIAKQKLNSCEPIFLVSY